uniref:CRAL-TRIO domain-containing protein n=1 Tax=Kalanchoe fedtschenkoi TaxID=63787 RepID=A0A7N0RGG9_KALFE
MFLYYALCFIVRMMSYNGTHALVWQISHYTHSHIQLNEYRDRVVLPSATIRFGRYIGTCIKVLDMTGLNLSTLNQIKLLTLLSTIDDLNYPEKTDIYYIVNVPYIFLACWKVVKPLLKERTRKKIQVLHGSGKDELLQIMDYESLPHFCKEQSSGSSKYFPLSLIGSTEDCFSADHPFHQGLYDYVEHQQSLFWKSRVPIKEESFQDDIPEPDPDSTEIALTTESELQKNGE